MFINLKENKLVITFGYSPQLVTAVKSITGRVWNLKQKRWEVPVENVDECLSILEPLGFQPTVEVKSLAREEKAVFQAADYIRTAGAVLPDLPASLPLYLFQKIGASFLRSMPHSLLADAPGLGKSIQTIAALWDTPGPHLILVPNSLKFSWADEIEKWMPDLKDSHLVIDGAKEIRRTQWFYAHTKKFVVCNYELLLHDFADINKITWNTIVCDEATRISNAEAKTTRALKTLKSLKRIALTGTPISNSPVDIFSIIDWLAPKYLGTLYQFKARYCVMDSFWNVLGYKDLEHLAGRVARFMLRRTKEEVLTDFPKKTIENITFPLSDLEYDLYDKVRRLLIEELEKLTVDKFTLGIIPVKMLRLKQLTDHPALISEGGYSTKLNTLLQIVKPIVLSGEKIIIFTQFAEMLKILMAKLSVYEPLAIYGDVPAEERQEAVRKFTVDPKHKIMVMTEAGAYGLNLQAASTVIHYDLPWSVAKMQQREDRAHRHGQTKPVSVYNLIAKGTIDEYVAKVLHKKNKASVAILDDESRLENAGLTEEDIKSILRI